MSKLWRLQLVSLLVMSVALASGDASAQARKSKDVGQAPKSAERRPLVRADQARNYERAPGREPEDVALFVPRLLLAVPRYTLKVFLFPVRETIRYVDRHAIVEKVTDVLYNDERTAAVLPSFAIDSFLGPSLGVKAFHRDLAGHDEYGSAEARFGGAYTLATQLHFRAEHFGGTRLWLESIARFESSPGLLFQGIGHAAAPATATQLNPHAGSIATRYSEQRLLNLLRAGYSFGQPGEMLQIGATGIFNVRDFGAKQKGAEPSIEEVYDTRRLVGFADRSATLETDLNLIVDLRDVAGATASGFYLELFAGRVPRLGGDYQFWHQGAELATYFNLYKRTRVLVLRAVVEGVEGPDQDIPFADLPRLGGPNRLRGYPLDRFRDEKAVVGSVEYHYPIHQYVAGSLYLDVGRVEKRYTDFFDRHFNAGAGGGLIFRSRDRQLFTFDVAYGEGVQFYLTTDPLRAFGKRDTEL